jgi:hypothetical protein
MPSPTIRTRYVLRRQDGRYFHNPTVWDHREWVAEVDDAHLWVDFDACKAAAFIRGKLRLEEVNIVELAIDYTTGTRYPLISTPA